MNTRICKVCDRDLPNAAYSYGRGECKQCRGAMARLQGRTLWRSPVAEKRCAACEETKPPEAFNRHPANADGLGTRCRDCLAACVTVYRADPETKRNRKWQQLLNNVPAFKRGNIGPLVFGVAA